MGLETTWKVCGEEFKDMLLKMTEKLGGEGLIKESCNGFNLLMNKDKGCKTLRDDELVSMLKEGDYDGDGTFNPMEFCVLMFRLSPESMMESKALLDHALQQEFDSNFKFFDTD
ncbi:putative EF-hand domain-containing protein [Helianthus annuus]|uniref:EF-hand domain-containing protein n=1 Tax=Helianthus annuus TaxID=4232 RepID=A0A251S8F4_HELAN|nr:putative EF-hand domain-containing protein [Helianthus annuus]KAJ0451180.1 putative calcium-binding protein KIC/PBP1/KRP1 [Helianthus annuus]KAJ0455608.1 putative EF-hand domain-containing protein [Helianthus annuus]KAJ0473050.1 putative calcium-binding protein KIC/PBP1/KRP1 [Helianthus annuus]KAJ0648652.1 putative calcium-binding protein KIC/PBP1/KRP1 [Helianthus annuus]